MPVENANVNAYLRTKVLTAPPEQLRMLLLDGAVKFCSQGIDALRGKDWEGVYTGFSNCRNIVMELMNSVKPDVDPDLCSRVQSLYLFIFNQLVEASFEKDIGKAEKCLSLLQYERETWSLLLDQLAKERTAGTTGAAGLEARSAPIVAPEGSTTRRQPLSIQG